MKQIDPIMIRGRDAARALSMSVDKLYALLEIGEGPPAVKFGPKPNSSWHFHYPTLLRWAAQQSRKGERRQTKIRQKLKGQ